MATSFGAYCTKCSNFAKLQVKVFVAYCFPFGYIGKDHNQVPGPHLCLCLCHGATSERVEHISYYDRSLAKQMALPGSGQS